MLAVVLWSSWFKGLGALNKAWKRRERGYVFDSREIAGELGAAAFMASEWNVGRS